jgi:hypothetical protein
LDVVDEVNVVIVLRLFKSTLRLDSLGGQTEEGMSYLTFSNFAVEAFVAVSSLDVTDFVAPPHD